MENREKPSDLGSEVPTFRQEVGTRLREIENRFKNRESAAKCAGVAKSTLQSWIEGRADPSFEAVSRLSRETGVSIDWIAFGAEEPTSAGAAPDDETLRAVMDAVAFEVEGRGLHLRPTQFARLCQVVYRLITESGASNRAAAIKAALELVELN
ncbi:MAG: helix-turn-helix domain containing protein [Alphaproteobacteria bacterium]|nr:helix-turn-helix domain containing protein [Alphaproteobacteria bacterium]